MSFEIRDGDPCRIFLGNEESEAVKIAAGNLKTDLEKVLVKSEGRIEIKELTEKSALSENNGMSIIIQTINPEEPGETETQLLDSKGQLRKEAYCICVQNQSMLIKGTDRRGTVYGIYEICAQIGVSPWYFFADVPVKKKALISFPDGYERIDYPSVEYRGIFINDEEELESWVRNYMGEETIGIKTYERIFELLLRLKANYIWPAMHVNSFNMVPENGALANRMGIVVGTSHCDMLMRSNNREWKPWIQKKGYSDAVYDYSIPGRNRSILNEYWRESIEQNKNFEVSYTLGMRGIHDSGFETKDLEGRTEEERRRAKIALLETIIKEQRKLLEEVIGQDTLKTFVPYKEVLDLYDHGLNVPEDMTLIWANDNYGYIRRYPSEKEQKRPGGNGIYYHNSYWAPPSMSYVFLCSIPLAHTKNELTKAYEEGIQKLWVLNCGALKPLEQEIEFFLTLAWEIGKEASENETVIRKTDDVEFFTEQWINQNFTGGIGKKVSVLLNDFSQITNVRKVENMSSDAFSQDAYGDEAAVRIHEYERLFEEGNALYESLPEAEKDAFFQLVLMRIHAAYFTNLSYYYGDRSTRMHRIGNMQASAYYTEKARQMEDARRKMISYYNKGMANGKWNGILDPEGFPPPRAAMMPICTPPLFLGERKLNLCIWNEGETLTFIRPAVKWIEIGNAGRGTIRFRIQAPDWVELSESEGEVSTEKRILVTVTDGSRNRRGELVISDLSDGTQKCVPVFVNAYEHTDNIEEDGILVLEADAASSLEFQKIQRLGRYHGNLMQACKQNKAEEMHGSPLNYSFTLRGTRTCTLELHRFPSLNSVGRIRVGVSVDDGEPVILETQSNDEWRENWKKNVQNNVDRLYWKLPELKAGEHRLSIYAIDSYVAFSRLILYTKERKENNLAGIALPPFDGRSGQTPFSKEEWIQKSSLPRDLCTPEWENAFYGEIELSPRPVFYAPWNASSSSLDVTNRIDYPEAYGKTVSPTYFFDQGAHAFQEKEGIISIDCASALAQSHSAYTENGPWEYCSSESYGRSGLAMYIRNKELHWECHLDAPSLNYQFVCDGGDYTLWVCLRFETQEENHLALAMDGVLIEPDQMYQKGDLFRYEAEQIYRFVPLTKIHLEQGIHQLKLLALAGGMQYDCIRIKKGNSFPALSCERQDADCLNQ